MRLAVFDCDGTLVDSQRSIVAAMHAAFDLHGLERPESARIRRVVGLPLEEAIRRLVPVDGLDTIGGLARAYKDAFSRHRESGAGSEELLYPGVAETLQGLGKKGWSMGVATGKSLRGLRAVLDQHRLGSHFVTLQTSDVGPGKPAPDMLLRAMAETGVAARHTVMIGDTTFDMEMAVNARVKAIGVGWGYHAPEELTAAGATILVDDFGAIEPALERLTGIAR